MAKKHKKSKGKSPLPKIPHKQDIPVYDFFEDHSLDTTLRLGQSLEDLIYCIKGGYFFLWEAIVCDEQGLPITEKQQEALDEIISFSEDEDEPILYINEFARPSEPWYEIIKKVVPKLVLDTFKTYAPLMKSIMRDGYH